MLGQLEEIRRESHAELKKNRIAPDDVYRYKAVRSVINRHLRQSLASSRSGSIVCSSGASGSSIPRSMPSASSAPRPTANIRTSSTFAPYKFQKDSSIMTPVPQRSSWWRCCLV